MGRNFKDRNRPTVTSSVTTMDCSEHPWFYLPRLAGSETDPLQDPYVKIYLSAHPCPPALLLQVTDNDFPEDRTVLMGDIIEGFLKGGEYRILTGDSTPDFDAAAESNVIEVTDDIASEQLAQIYMEQGLTKEAKEIYRKLEEAGKKR